MISEQMNKIRKSVRDNNPLIHCITNPISINQCANAILATGARPIMAEHPDEVSEITLTSRALMLNTGNITDARLKSISISAETADKNKIPYILDAVGVACSELRRKYVYSLTEKYHPTVIKGNYSEINALYNSEYSNEGVDADLNLDNDYIIKISATLAKKYNSIILASGKTDIVTDGKKHFLSHNGTDKLSKITGTGCMLGALSACYLSECTDITAVITACTVLGICGELSGVTAGNGTFFINLMDNLSLLTNSELEKYSKTEEATIEKI